MKLLKTIADGDQNSCTQYREAARAIVFDKENRIPILYVAKYSYHKLPGGGLKPDESKQEGLKREIKEETGCEIEVQGEVGRILEYRIRFKLEQISYCYFGKVLGKGKLSFTEKEKRAGFELVWLTLDEALENLREDNPENYEGSFIQRRDLEFLKEARELFD